MNTQTFTFRLSGSQLDDFTEEFQKRGLKMRDFIIENLLKTKQFNELNDEICKERGEYNQKIKVLEEENKMLNLHCKNIMPIADSFKEENERLRTRIKVLRSILHRKRSIF